MAAGLGFKLVDEHVASVPVYRHRVGLPAGLVAGQHQHPGNVAAGSIPGEPSLRSCCSGPVLKDWPTSAHPRGHPACYWRGAHPGGGADWHAAAAHAERGLLTLPSASRGCPAPATRAGLSGAPLRTGGCAGRGCRGAGLRRSPAGAGSASAHLGRRPGMLSSPQARNCACHALVRLSWGFSCRTWPGWSSRGSWRRPGCCSCWPGRGRALHHARPAARCRPGCTAVTRGGSPTPRSAGAGW
jgi:hypothetical protein